MGLEPYITRVSRLEIDESSIIGNANRFYGYSVSSIGWTKMQECGV